MAPLPRWKRWAFAAVVVVLVVGAAELMGKAAGMAVEGGRFSRSRLQAQRDALLASGGRTTVGANVRWARDEVLHPYLGYAPGGGAGAPGLGFAAPEPIQRRAPDRLIVAVVGGSAAHLFAEQGLAELGARLARLPAYRGRALAPLNLAVGGYKQPQQLMAIAYLFALGGEVDVVVNLDGFNEVTMHPTENAAAGVPPAYPRRWDQRIEGLFQGGTLRLMLQRVDLERRRSELAGTFSAFPLRASNAANAVYLALDRRLERELGATDRALVAAPGGAGAPGASASAGGPPTARSPASAPAGPPGASPRGGVAGEREMYERLAELWQRSSLQLSRLVEASGARYYHFLQPNQYVPGSKPMGADERAVAIIPDHPYRRAVETGYPLLQRAGAALVKDGVRFADLTGAFAARAEPLYFDSCCHVNARGNAILAELMSEVIRRDTDAR